MISILSFQNLFAESSTSQKVCRGLTTTAVNIVPMTIVGSLIGSLDAYINNADIYSLALKGSVMGGVYSVFHSLFMLQADGYEKMSRDDVNTLGTVLSLFPPAIPLYLLLVGPYLPGYFASNYLCE